jgi:hypothetical protein
MTPRRHDIRRISQACTLLNGMNSSVAKNRLTLIQPRPSHCAVLIVEQCRRFSLRVLLRGRSVWRKLNGREQSDGRLLLLSTRVSANTRESETPNDKSRYSTATDSNLKGQEQIGSLLLAAVLRDGNERIGILLLLATVMSANGSRLTAWNAACQLWKCWRDIEQTSRRNEYEIRCRSTWSNQCTLWLQSLKRELWHSKHAVTSSYKHTDAKQWIKAKQNCWRQCFMCGPCRGYIVSMSTKSAFCPRRAKFLEKLF